MIKIAVLVSGGGTNLQALINAQEEGIIKNGKITLVISNNSNAYALERAKYAKIKSVVVSKKQCANSDEFNSKLIQVLKENDIDLVVLAGFLCILSKDFINAFKNRIINVHPSLIPSFCGDGYYGLKVHEKALEYGVKVTGATVHFVNEVVDGGKIIMQKAVNVRKNDTPITLQKRVMQQAEWKILPKSVELVCSSLKNGEEL
ncbi:MAG: phosphoribosylglycinamide formyltransferase [Clostridia bacterium]|nr:phosphoribosylglycinamide formyltransferase [Clostridia bacterium]